MGGISHLLLRSGSCSGSGDRWLRVNSRLLRCLSVIAILMVLGCQRSPAPSRPINDAESVCGFWIDDDRFHVVTTAYHWIWRDGRWHRELTTGGNCTAPSRFFRTPANTVIDLSEGRLTLEPVRGDALTTSGDSPWIVDLIVHSPPPYFSAQRDYGHYPIRIYAIDVDGSIWRGSMARSGAQLLVERVDRLADGAQPLRLALKGDRLFCLYRYAGALHIDGPNTVFRSVERLQAL